MGGQDGLFFYYNLLVLVVLLSGIDGHHKHGLTLHILTVTSEDFPEKGTPCWRPLFSGFRLLLTHFDVPGV